MVAHIKKLLGFSFGLKGKILDIKLVKFFKSILLIKFRSRHDVPRFLGLQSDFLVSRPKLLGDGFTSVVSIELCRAILQCRLRAALKGNLGV